MSVSHSNISEYAILHTQYLLFSISCITPYMTCNILSFKRADLMSDYMTPLKSLQLYKTCSKYSTNSSVVLVSVYLIFILIKEGLCTYIGLAMFTVLNTSKKISKISTTSNGLHNLCTFSSSKRLWLYG